MCLRFCLNISSIYNIRFNVLVTCLQYTGNIVYIGEKKLCLVPVTRPYLFFSPDPKLFCHWNTKKIGPIFYSIFKKISKKVFKRSGKHSKNKTNLIILTSVLKLLYVALIEVNINNFWKYKNIVCVKYLILKHWIFIFILFFVSRCVRWSDVYFLEQSCWLL